MIIAGALQRAGLPALYVTGEESGAHFGRQLRPVGIRGAVRALEDLPEVAVAGAVVQAVASAVQRRVLPGTLTGVVLMLPAALWLLVLLPGARLWAMAGIALTAPLLAVIWALAWASSN